METTKAIKTISEIFKEFLTDQKNRINARTFMKYQTIIELYGSYLNRYWPGHDGEGGKITEAERAGEAAKDLPNATEVLDLLNTYCDEHAPAKHGGEIQDHFWIDRIEPGKLWLNPLTAAPSGMGPIPVPKRVTALCEPGWDFGGVVAKFGKGWRLLEVWKVSP
jgi:hypothetical protein